MQKPGALRAELVVRKPAEAPGLAGSGLVIFNPPWKLDEELLTLLPDLCAVMQQSSDAAAKIESLGT
jgi:23S rRNA (adenine2030-N6)-methyltransferase